ncbi:aspartate/glutamate racemase family protein [Streptomyces sp. NPDC002795]|uniref:aspartate/glutamate racemase family protein n=1 Tax=Streptomyces sp. NPDC002795 TaxID=3364665 RepID=UPI00367A86BE
MTRIAFLHTGAVVIPTFTGLAAELLPGMEVQHLLDDRIVADLGRGAAPAGIAARLSALGRAAATSGASALVFSCSSISAYAAPLAEELGIPVFRIDEAMADEAVGGADRVSVVATLETTLRPTAALLRERARLLGREVELTEVVVAGAFEAVAAGDREQHDILVSHAVERQAAAADVVVLAQASMATAARRSTDTVPVLSSPELGMRRIAGVLGDIT